MSPHFPPRLRFTTLAEAAAELPRRFFLTNLPFSLKKAENMQEKIRLRPVSLLVQIGGMKKKKRKRCRLTFVSLLFERERKWGGNNRKR